MLLSWQLLSLSLSLWGLQATGIRHRIIGLGWAHECHNIVLETLLVAWLQLQPEEITTVLRGGRVVNRKPDGRRPVSLESQAVAFWACDILAKLMRECVPLAPHLCRRHQPPDVWLCANKFHAMDALIAGRGTTVPSRCDLNCTTQ
jgi:hypothetical protein